MASGNLDPDCIFCKIIRGEIPAQRVFENDHLLAFLDINPLATGHTVVIPKTHAERLEQLPADTAGEVARSFGAIATALLKVTGAEGYNVLQNNGSVAGQVVPHVHFHLVPRRADDGLGYRWNAKSATAEELTALADRVRGAL